MELREFVTEREIIVRQERHGEREAQKLESEKEAKKLESEREAKKLEITNYDEFCRVEDETQC